MKNITVKVVKELKNTLNEFNKDDKTYIKISTATSCTFEYGYTIKKKNKEICFIIGHKETNLRKILSFVIKKHHQYQRILNGERDCRFIQKELYLYY